MSNITYATIRQRIKSTALELVPALPKEATYEAWEAFQEACQTLQEEAYDKASEDVGFWDWTTYTYQGFQVYDALSSAEQNEAESLFEDVGGYEQASEQQMGPYEMGCAMATHWLVQEVTKEIESLCEEFIEMAENEMENLQ